MSWVKIQGMDAIEHFRSKWTGGALSEHVDETGARMLLDLMGRVHIRLEAGYEESVAEEAEVHGQAAAEEDPGDRPPDEAPAGPVETDQDRLAALGIGNFASEAPEAGRRDLLRLRVFLHDRQFMDLATLLAWPQWLEVFRFYQGIAHDNGFIPAGAIAMIVHLNAAGEPVKPEGDNVVLLRPRP